MRTFAIYEKNAKGMMLFKDVVRFPVCFSCANVKYLLGFSGKDITNLWVTYH